MKTEQLLIRINPKTKREWKKQAGNRQLSAWLHRQIDIAYLGAELARAINDKPTVGGFPPWKYANTILELIEKKY